MTPGARGARRVLPMILPLALAGCASLADTSLHVAFERSQRREGFRRVAVVLEDFYYCYPPTREVFRVKKGFETDFASIPYWASAVISPIGDGAEAAVVHDWLYAVGRPGGRDEADAVLLYGLKQAHVSPIQAKLMYEAVRAGGAGAYGAPGEWRFVDPETEKAIRPPPKPRTAVVAVLKSCEDLRAELPRLRLLSAAAL